MSFDADAVMKGLIYYVQTRTPLPFEWAVASLPDGTCQAAWDGCQNAKLLVQLYAYGGDRYDYVAMLCACARTVIKLAPKPPPVLRLAEAWARARRGLVDPALPRAGGQAYQRSDATDDPRHAAVYNTLFGITCVVATISKTPTIEASWGTALGVVGNAAEALAPGVLNDPAALARLADVVRGVVPIAPSLAQLGLAG